MPQKSVTLMLSRNNSFNVKDRIDNLISICK